jgi:hypothetical protein
MSDNLLVLAALSRKHRMYSNNTRTTASVSS